MLPGRFNRGESDTTPWTFIIVNRGFDGITESMLVKSMNTKNSGCALKPTNAAIVINMITAAGDLPCFSTYPDLHVPAVPKVLEIGSDCVKPTHEIRAKYLTLLSLLVP